MKENPNASGQDVLDLLRGYAEKLAKRTEPTHECRRCGQGIWYEQVADKWRHADPDNSVSCYAASFRSGSGWDKGLSRSWKAAPPD